MGVPHGLSDVRHGTTGFARYLRAETVAVLRLGFEPGVQTIAYKHVSIIMQSCLAQSF